MKLEWCKKNPLNSSLDVNRTTSPNIHLVPISEQGKLESLPSATQTGVVNLMELMSSSTSRRYQNDDEHPKEITHDKVKLKNYDLNFEVKFV